MPLSKTPDGLAALKNRCKSLKPLDRQILILCDGKRKRDEVLRMVSLETGHVIDTLLARGLLTDGKVNPQANRTAELTDTQKIWLHKVENGQASASDFAHSVYASTFAEASKPFENSRPTPSDFMVKKPDATVERITMPQELHPKVDSSLQIKSRRSMAASKMYMLDMLQLIRKADAATWRVAIQTCTSDLELINVFCRALEFMHQESGASFAVKAAKQMVMILPEEVLPAMQNFVTEREWLADVRDAHRVHAGNAAVALMN